MVHISVLGQCGHVYTDTLVAPTTEELVAALANHIAQGREILAVEQNDSELEAWLDSKSRLTEKDIELINEKDWWC